MSKEYNSSSYKEYDKDSSGKSITIRTEKESLFFSSCIAISPDGKKIVTFSPETRKFNLYDTDDLSSGKSIPAPKSVVDDKHLFWFIAISNFVDDDRNERFIALSCFDKMRHVNKDNSSDDENDEKSDDKENDLELGNKVNNQNINKNDLESGSTWVISTTDENKNYTSSIGGVIRFLDNDDSSLENKTVIIIVNASGIYKETIKRKQRFFSRSSKIKQFKLPEQLATHLSPHDWQNSLELLCTSIIKNYFMVHSFENRQEIIEMYSLITGDLEMLFKRHESSVVPNIIRGSPIFAISQNEKILAFCRGTTNITLYFVENGLEITTKQLDNQRGSYKIVAINFIDDDSKLLIFLEEKDQISKHHQIFVVWDLFTTFKNSIRQIDCFETLKMDVNHGLINSSGKMFAVRDNGDIFSVLDHKDVASIRNPMTPSEKKMTKIDITRDNSDHLIYNVDGERSDTSKLIINNVEPWHPNENYFRISVYLDSAKRTQLIVSQNTIQVWKYRNDKRDRVLECIWAWNRPMNVHELIIGEREFVLKVSIPSVKCPTALESVTIHWPNNLNVLRGACRSLYVLGKMKHNVKGHENVNQIKYLVECTQTLVRKYITKYSIFRLTCIKYPIMKYLIKSYQESLIIHILNKKINGKNSNIYIPRLYEKADQDKKKSDQNNNKLTKSDQDNKDDPTFHYLDNKLSKSDQDNKDNKKSDQDDNELIDQDNEDNNRSIKSDLNYAILCIKKRGDFKVIIKHLIDYYADNAKEYNNHGWMCTVSKAIPLLYDKKLGEFVHYLFKKPGIIEAYTPPLHIDPYDQMKGNDTAVIHSLDEKPRLALKFHNTFKSLFPKIETSDNNRKVYIVPLHDFTVCKDPEVQNENYSRYFQILFTLFRISLWPRWEVIDDSEKMREFVHYLFKKPGIIEAYTPPLHIDPYDQMKGNDTAVIHSLDEKPRLALKFHNTFKSLFPKIETSDNNRKVYIVPLHDFTVCKDPEVQNENYSRYFQILFTLFRISLWPRWEVIDDSEKMSPFLRVIREEKSYEIYQSPIIMAVLDFKWPAARRYFLRHIIMYMLYILGFVLSIGAHDSKQTDYLFKIESKTILKISLFVYFYTGWHLIATEIVQLKREGSKRYISIYNMFDLGSVLLPLACNIVMALDYHGMIILQNSAFNSVLATTALVTWLELLFLSRYLEVPGRFIDIIKSILITVLPFLGVMFIVVLAFGHAMFILLNYADELQIPTYKIRDSSDPNLYTNITIYQNIDKSSRLDNYYSHFASSIEAVFFWTNGRWEQLNQWNSYAVDVISILGSIILVLIFQNMLIAFMNDAFDKANKKSLIAVYRRRAKIIAEYEVSVKPFGSRRGPQYIYYIPDPDMIDTWLKKDEKQILRHMGESEEFDYNYDDDDDDDDGDDDDDNNDNNNDNQDNSSYSKKYRHEDPSSTMDSDSDSIEPITTEYKGTINKISFIDEEIFSSKVLASKLNRKSNFKLAKNNKSSNEDPSPTKMLMINQCKKDLKTWRQDLID
ncbi:hypothetical protein Glove_168g167 [Diversispora epigaea]|uniref:Ion transport domain-containing protein n=1 Tax=Diversispora epigaea TaxID=1348612 RepID=A0A397IZF9_9GLOM|nr:hypothetical protein Glove_168g167 [Diversispora epigaea]